MKLSKNITSVWTDRFKVEKEKVVEIRLTSSKINLKSITLNTILKILCISLKCSQNCNGCLLKNEDTFKKYLEEKGITDGKET